MVGIELGTNSTGAPVELDLEELLSTRLLAQGNSGSGKSHLLRRLLEQSSGWVQQAVIDPEGDFVTLADRFGHIVVDAERSEADLHRIASRIRLHRASAVLSLEGLEAETQMRCAAAFLNGLFEADRDSWFPMLVVVDEAQLFAPSVAGEVSDEARKVSLGAMTNLMCRGRKRGLAGIIATQRLAKLAKNVAAEASNFLMGRTFLDIDMARAADLLGMDRRQAEAFRDLRPGEFVALGPALTRRPLSVRIGEVETAARSGRPKLIPLPDIPAENLHARIFEPGANEPPRVPFRRPAAASTAEVLVRLAAVRPAGESVEVASDVVVPDAERDNAIAAILAEILADHEAAFRPVAILYQDFLVHCRIRRLGGALLDLPTFRQRLAVARAGVGTESGGEAWVSAVALARTLPEEMQGLFLVIARAAMEGAACPSDATLARVYGSRSPSRGRRIVAFMEEAGTLACRIDFRGHRVIAVPEFGWETEPGDPGAADFEEIALSAAE